MAQPQRLEELLEEALAHITDKPWDDSTHLHKRICEALGKPISYPDWPYEESYCAPSNGSEPHAD